MGTSRQRQKPARPGFPSSLSAFAEDEELSEDEQALLLANFRRKLAGLHGEPAAEEASDEEEKIGDKRLAELGYKRLPHERVLTSANQKAGFVPESRNHTRGMIAVNDVAGLEQKLEEIRYKPPAGMRRVPWIETLAVVASPQAEASTTGADGEEPVGNEEKKTHLPGASQDLAREKYFISLTTEAARVGLTRLRQLHLKFTRPSDFLAEMLKSDSHMARVRERLAAEKDQLEDFEEKKRKKMNKKFQRLSGHKLVREQEEARRRNAELKDIAAWKKDREQKAKSSRSGDGYQDAESAFDAWVKKKDQDSLEEERAQRQLRKKRARGEVDADAKGSGKKRQRSRWGKKRK
ncbi:conserved hypothetical protein [Neospora caninum Liverpool]|uniref:Probable rRNA-processing protein EBP2 homolog n=1 Tax=Neospora caninum (strain Liverpool) TaxID=572307 RepID=F0VQC7_NEOCL|nr:conserved hypothetical protein [Neospora caninum Liverpool]CBZ55924.1 conserved hypothetical protein [Neospora caninum Liverpool]CEL70667.1 TPA: Probable rRNA-processing protein EBP2 homolog [Neospora caninum Liverpool]|eukprot:XP_003885950.1 conserved hypothetical protein [Neospora caninum Liverpool]